MPQSLSNVIVDIVFRTKKPWVDTAMRPRMHRCLATICRDSGGKSLSMGGALPTMFHIVTTLPRTLSQAELIERIEKSSSKWAKNTELRYRRFSWQRGYAIFSVSQSQLKTVLQYVQRQPEHHRTRTFEQEYRELLGRHGVEFDEQYVWD
jgi:putative transposase